MPTADGIVRTALTYEGVPEKHQGRDRHGVDCIGLLVAVAVEAGVPGAERFLLPEYRSYGRVPPAGLVRSLARYMQRASEPAPGRVGLFTFGGDHASHVAIFGYGQMIHSFHPQRKVVAHGYVSPWPDRLRAVFAFPGVG